MAVEVINRNQQVIRAGLRPRTVYSRIVVLELSTGSGGGQREAVESTTLASRGIVHKMWIHSHGRTVNQVQVGTMKIGIGRVVEAAGVVDIEVAQRLIQNHGGEADSINLTGVDHDTVLDMGVEFVGEKTRVAARVITNNNFTSDYQVFFQISEG